LVINKNYTEMRGQRNISLKNISYSHTAVPISVHNVTDVCRTRNQLAT